MYLWNGSEDFAEDGSTKCDAERITDQGEDVSDHELLDGDGADLVTPIMLASGQSSHSSGAGSKQIQVSWNQ